MAPQERQTDARADFEKLSKETVEKEIRDGELPECIPDGKTTDERKQWVRQQFGTLPK